jgi:hypothetical protein
MLATNLIALSPFRLDSEFSSYAANTERLNAHLTRTDRVLVLSCQHEAWRLVNEEPFSPLAKNRYLFHVAVPRETDHMASNRKTVPIVPSDGSI